jgi:hypothetical protein
MYLHASCHWIKRSISSHSSLPSSSSLQDRWWRLACRLAADGEGLLHSACVPLFPLPLFLCLSQSVQATYPTNRPFFCSCCFSYNWIPRTCSPDLNLCILHIYDKCNLFMFKFYLWFTGDRWLSPQVIQVM